MQSPPKKTPKKSKTAGEGGGDPSAPSSSIKKAHNSKTTLARPNPSSAAAAAAAASPRIRDMAVSPAARKGGIGSAVTSEPLPALPPLSPVPEAMQRLVAPHLDSFNCFAERGLAAAIERVDPVEVTDEARKIRYKVWLESPTVNKPASEEGIRRPVYPSECREGGFSYRGELRADLCIEGFDLDTPSQHGLPSAPHTAATPPSSAAAAAAALPAVFQNRINVSLGRMPVMVKSSLCHLHGASQRELVSRKEEALEMGGYFICNGIERLVRLIIAPRRNYVIALKRGSLLRKGTGFTDMATSIRCVRPDETSVSLRVVYVSDGSAVVNFSLRKREYFIPIGIILKALLEVTDAEIYDRVASIATQDEESSDASTVAAGRAASLGTDFVRERALLILSQARSKGLFTRVHCLSYLGSFFRHLLELPARLTDAEVGERLIRDFILVHLDDNQDKFNLLIFMLHKLFALVDGTAQEDNADALSHHEVLLPGQILTRIVKERVDLLLNKFAAAADRQLADKPGRTDLRDGTVVKKLLEKVPVNVGQVVESFLNTGNISSQTGLDLQQASGFTVVAEKLNFLRFISHFRSVHRGAYFASLRTTTVRKLLPESWGFLCPVHTPDGAPCGLLNHLTMPCSITTDEMPNPKFSSHGTSNLTPSKDGPPSSASRPARAANEGPTILKSRDVIGRRVAQLLSSLGLRLSSAGLPPPPPPHFLTVMLDGFILGHLPANAALPAVSVLREQKVARDSLIPPDLEVAYIPFSPMGTFPGIFLFSSAARFVRPVRQLDGDKAVELVGTLEQVFLEVRCHDGGASGREIEGEEGVPRATHEELHPTAMLSVVANLTPWSDYNQSPRNMYQCQMGKQTMGVPLHAWRHRTDNKLYRLQTPQTPIAKTRHYSQHCMDDYPTGTNAVVAVLAYTGYDMEDAMIINKSSMERGFAHGSIYTTQTIDNSLQKSRSNESSGVVFKRVWQKGGQGIIDADGLPGVGERVKAEEAYCSMFNTATLKPSFLKLKGSEEAVVDAVTLQGLGQRHSLKKVSVRMRYGRNPVIGDKFSSRHGQKGVLSQLWPDEDMPFCDTSGIRPDIIINPHAFPSRMTIGMLVESMASKSGALHGHFVNATTFQSSSQQPEPMTWQSSGAKAALGGQSQAATSAGISGSNGQEDGSLDGFRHERNVVDEFGRQLVTKGFSYYGTETMYSGVYGTEMPCDIFIGVVYYQRLRHMVSDKFQVRSTGPVNPVTQQPVKGRKKGGGIRFGEMERDALLSHGAAYLLHDRLHTCSDYHTAHVCSTCGSLISPSPLPPRVDPIMTLGLQGIEGSRNRKVECRICQGKSQIVKVAMPYVFRYLAAELTAMNIRLNLCVSD